MPGPAQKVSAEQKAPEREKKAPKAAAPATGQRVLELQERISRDLRETTKVQSVTQSHSYLDSVLNQLEVILPKDRVEDLKRVAARFLSGDKSISAEAVLTESRAELRKSSQADLLMDSDSDDDVPPDQKELLKKIRQAMYSYVESGTDYSLASGRVWATRNKCAEVMPFLFSSLENLSKEQPILIGSIKFRHQLENIRAELELQQSYVEFKKRSASREATERALQRRNISIIASSIESLEILVTKDLKVNCLANCLYESLNGKESYSDDFILNSIYADIAKANPGLGSLFEDPQKNGKLKSIPGGSHLEVLNTEPGRVLVSRDLERSAALIELLLVSRFGASKPNARISLETEDALKKLLLSIQPTIKLMQDEKNRAETEASVRNLYGNELLRMLIAAKAQGNAEDFLITFVPHLEALCRKGNSESQDLKADHEIELAEALYKKASELITKYDPVEVDFEKFLKEFKQNTREIAQEIKLSPETRANLLKRVQTLLEQRLLSFAHEAAAIKRNFSINDEEVTYSWTTAKGLHAFAPLLEKPVNEVESAWGLDLSDPHFIAELDKCKAEFRRTTTEQSLEVLSSDTTKFFQGYEAKGFEINKATLLEHPSLTLSKDMTLQELVVALFGASDDQKGDFVPTSLHYQLLEQSNPDLEEIFAQAKQVAPEEIKLPKGAAISIKTTAQGMTFQHRLIKEMLLHHQLVLNESNCGLEKLSQGAIEIAKERIQGLEQILEDLEAKRLVARCISATARALGTFQSEADYYSRETPEKDFEAARIIEDHFARVFELIDKVEKDQRTKHLAPELRLQCNLYKQQAGVAFGITLLGAQRGEHSRQAFESALRISEQVLQMQELSNEQKEKICMFRSELYRRIALTYLHGTNFLNYFNEVQGRPNLESDATANWFLDQCTTGIREAYEHANEELHRARNLSGGTFQLDEALNASRVEQHRLWADLYGTFGKPLQRYQHLGSAVALLVGRSAYEFTMLEPDTSLNIDEATGRLTSSWYGTDEFPALSQQHLGEIVSDIQKLPRTKREQVDGLLLMMAQSALEEDDNEQSIGRAMVVNQVLAELAEKPYATPTQIFLRKLIQAQVSFRFGQGEDHPEAMHYALTELEALSEFANVEKVQVPEVLLSLRDSQLFRFRMELANSDKDRSSEYVRAIQQQRIEQKKKDDTRIVVINAELDALGDEFRAAFDQNKMPAQHKLTRADLLRKEVQVRRESQAKLMLQEAISNLHSSNPEHAKEVLEQLRKEYGDEFGWVRPKVAKIFSEAEKGGFTAALQTALNELNTETFGEYVETAIPLTVAFAAVGSLIGPEGTIIGGLIGQAVTVGTLKARNLYRGWGRISQSYSSGLSTLSVQNSLLNTLFLAADIANIVVPFKGASTIIKGGAKEAFELTLKETKALCQKEGLQLTEQQIEKLAWKNISKEALKDMTKFGGRWVTYLNLASFSLPVSLQVYDVYTDESLSDAQKQNYYRQIATQAAKAGFFLSLMWGAQFTVLRFSNRPSRLTRQLGAELELAAKAKLETQIEPAVKATEPRLSVAETTPSNIEIAPKVENSKLAKLESQIKEISARLAQGVEESLERLLKAQRRELEEMAGELKPAPLPQEKAPPLVNDNYLRPLSTPEIAKAQDILDTMHGQLENLKSCAELEGKFGKANDVEIKLQRVWDLTEYLDQLKSQRKAGISDDTIAVEREIHELMKTLDDELAELKAFSENFDDPPDFDAGADDWRTPPGDEPLGGLPPEAPEPRSGGGGGSRSSSRGLQVLDAPRTVLKAGQDLIHSIDNWFKARAESAEKTAKLKRPQTRRLEIIPEEVKPPEMVRIEVEPETRPIIESEALPIPQELLTAVDPITIRVAPPIFIRPELPPLDLPIAIPAEVKAAPVQEAEPSIVQPKIVSPPLRRPDLPFVEPLPPEIVRIEVTPGVGPAIEPEILPVPKDAPINPGRILPPLRVNPEIPPLEVPYRIPQELEPETRTQPKLEPASTDPSIQTKLKLKEETELAPQTKPQLSPQPKTKIATKTKTKTDTDTFNPGTFDIPSSKKKKPEEKRTAKPVVVPPVKTKRIEVVNQKHPKDKIHSRKLTPIKKRSAIGAEEYDQELKEVGAPEQFDWIKKESDF